MNLTFDDLEKYSYDRKQYLKHIKDGIAKTLKVQEDDVYIFGIEKGSKKIILQILD